MGALVRPRLPVSQSPLEPVREEQNLKSAALRSALSDSVSGGSMKGGGKAASCWVFLHAGSIYGAFNAVRLWAPASAGDQINVFFFLTQQLQQLPAASVRTGRLFLALHNKSSDTAQPFTDYPLQ